MNDANPLFDGPIDAPDVEIGPEEDTLRSTIRRTMPRTIPRTIPRRGLLGIAESRLLDLADDSKSEFARSFDGFVTMAREFADSIEQLSGGALGGYAQRAAGMVSEIQATLRDKPVEDLLDDGRELIRHSPRLTVAVAVLAGFVAVRLVKSSGR